MFYAGTSQSLSVLEPDVKAFYRVNTMSVGLIVARIHVDDYRSIALQG